MVRVFVVTLVNYYSQYDYEILGVAATMAEGKSMAEKKLQELIKGKYDWYENSTGTRAYLNVSRLRFIVRAYDVVGRVTLLD